MTLKVKNYFNEDFYLNLYPGVARAVAIGQFKSGYDHYLRCGQYENRKIALISKNEKSNQPLIYFVHIGKTAGSTVNANLKNLLLSGRAHCEAIINNDKLLGSAINESDWLSGHTPFNIAQSKLENLTCRPIKYFSTLREPTEQVMSHYNWLIEIYKKGEKFYEAHPKKIKEISEKIRSTPKTIDSIIKNLEIYSELFLNFQSRILMGMDFNDISKIEDTFKKFEFISDSNRVDLLISKIIQIPIKIREAHNISTYHFEKNIFQDKKIKEFLNKNNYYDYELYNKFKKYEFM